MKIGIATINLEYLLGNYGSLFQHFALRKIITSLGVTPVRLSETREYVNFVKQQILRGLIFFVFFWLKNRRIRRIRRTFIKKRMFRLFYAKNIGKIAENNRVCWDCLLAGSDQVWYEADEKNFLISYPDKIRRVSYAASCNWSVAEQDENWQKVAKRAFEKYSLISVREDSALPFLKKIVPDGIRLSCVLDPVLLLRREEYIALLPETKIFKSTTVFCYLLHLKREDYILITMLENLAEKLNASLKIVGGQGEEELIPGKYYMNLSPTDFLRAYRDSDYVVTNSYHGTIFSLVFEKRFITLMQTAANGNSNRQLDLLKKFGLKHHFFERIELDDIVTVLSLLDVEKIAPEIRTMREKSMTFLKEALQIGVEK